jgi:histidine ammonia-lyase
MNSESCCTSRKTIVLLNGHSLTISDIISIGLGKVAVDLNEHSKILVDNTWKTVQNAIREKRVIYGITTMFGNDLDVIMNEEQIQQFNTTILIQHATSHQTSHNNETIKPITRAAWTILLNGFAHGKSSVRSELVVELLRRINSDLVPFKDIEIKGSIGSADLIPLAQMAIHLVNDTFKFDAGEALAMMSSNAVSIARATFALRDTRKFMANAILSVAFSFEGLRANPSPFSTTVINSTSNPYKKKISEYLRSLMQDSKLLDDTTSKSLQSFLSLRDSTEILGLLLEAIEHAERCLLDDINAHQGNPVIDGESIVSTSNYDTTRSTNALLSVINAIGTVIQTSETRASRQYDRKFSGLSSGLSSSGGFDGIYTRNLPYWLCIFTREAMAHVNSAAMMTRFAASCSIAECVEDYNSPLPQIINDLVDLIPKAQKVICMEALFAVCAIERRNLANELATMMKPAYEAFSKVTPFGKLENEQYSLSDALCLYEISDNNPLLVNLTEFDNEG